MPISWMRLSSREKATAQKILSGTSGLVARHLNKKISLPISFYLARWGVKPNQITAFNLALGFLAAWIASLGGYLNLLLGGFLFQWVSIIDGCDGEVAKLNQTSSRFGAWFDTVGDNLSFVLFIVGVTVGLYHDTHAAWVLTAAKLTLVSFAILLSIMIHYLIRKADDKASLVVYEKEVMSQSVQGRPGPWAHFVHYGKFLVKKDFFAFLFFVLAVVNLPQGIVFFAALGSTAVAVILSGMTVKGFLKAPQSKPFQTEDSTTID